MPHTGIPVDGTVNREECGKFVCPCVVAASARSCLWHAVYFCTDTVERKIVVGQICVLAQWLPAAFMFNTVWGAFNLAVVLPCTRRLNDVVTSNWQPVSGIERR